MPVIKIRKDTRDELNSFISDDEIMDETINKLLDLTEEELLNATKINNPATNIKLSKDTMERIKSFKIYNGEGYDRIISRALRIANSK